MSTVQTANVNIQGYTVPFQFRQVEADIFRVSFKDANGTKKFVIRRDPAEGGFYSHVKGQKGAAIIEGGRKTPKAAFVDTIFMLFGV